VGQLFPNAIAPYAKAWVAFIGVLFVTLSEAWIDAPEWISIVGAVATVLGVWGVNNTSKPVPEPEPVVEEPETTAPVDDTGLDDPSTDEENRDG